MNTLTGFDYTEPQSTDDVLNQIRDSVVSVESGMRLSRHPLYHSIWTHEGLEYDELPEFEGVPMMGPAWLRLHIDRKLSDLNRFYKEHEWDRWLWTFERPYRPEALATIVKQLKAGPRGEHELARLIMEVWIDTEFPHVNSEEWEFLFGCTTVDLLNDTLSGDEKVARNELPGIVTVHRGCRGMKGHVAGWSHTLDFDMAMWFAKRFSPETHEVRVVSKLIPKGHLVGPINGRNEQEMIHLPTGTTRDTV